MSNVALSSRTPADLPLAAFTIWSILIVLASPDMMNALRGAGWWMCNGVVVFYLVLNSRMVTDRRDSLIAVLVFGAAIVGLTELIPYLAQTLETQQFTRLRSHKFSPILLSTIVVMSLPWSLTRSICAPPSALQKLYWLATFILSITAFLTLSRSGLVATASAGLFVLWPLKRKLQSAHRSDRGGRRCSRFLRRSANASLENIFRIWTNNDSAGTRAAAAPRRPSS